jgi:hypothetical protein
VLAAHLPITSVHLVPTTDDPIMVVRHVRMVSSSNYLEPCHHPDEFVGWLA